MNKNRDSSRRDAGKALSRNEDGQGLLEFSLIIVVLILILFGIIDFSRIFFAYATMSHAAREGVRYGIVHPGDPSNMADPNNQAILTIVNERMVLVGGVAEVDLEYPDGCADWLCPIRIHITGDMDVWTPVLPSLTLEAQATMHIE